MEGNQDLHKEGEESPKQEEERKEEPPKATGGGWGWGFSALSVLSDLQKAAEEISRNVRLCLSVLDLIFGYSVYSVNCFYVRLSW